MSHPFPYNYIAIEGNIGAGKTTLCKRLENRYNCHLILEQFSDNPFLPYFYENPERFAFPVELFFMTERHKQLQESLTQRSLFNEFIASDYFFVKTLLFAQTNLGREEFRLFQRLFNILQTSFPNPDLVVYLHQSPANLLQRIKERGRPYEQGISEEYLLKIQNAYFNYFKIDSSLPVLVMHVDNVDFLNKEDHFQQLIDFISRPYQQGVHHISFLL